jgi:hypothetical protein
MALFSYHTEWEQKLGSGVTGITVQDTDHGTIGFCLLRQEGRIDISFVHAIKHLPTSRTKNLLPQLLIDFKNGARLAVRDQIAAFRACNEFIDCGIAMEVDHVYPRTFDALLFQFCVEYKVNPLEVKVLELVGCTHYISDDRVRCAWVAYHAQHAILRFVPKSVNASAKKATIDWSATWAAPANTNMKGEA